jgi:hypothetical protein
MGTLLVMMASIGLMSGCGRTAQQITLATPTAPTAPVSTAPVAVPLTPDDGDGESPRKTPVVVADVPREPCRAAGKAPASQPVDQKPKKPCPKPKSTKKPAPPRWIPEPIAPQSYLNAGGMAPHPYMMRALR